MPPHAAHPGDREAAARSSQGRDERSRSIFYTYILASQRIGALYAGSTDDLAKRVFEHRSKARPGFTARHGVDQLVWFQAFEMRENAFRRERQIKEWRRIWKLRLIEEMNPNWRDLGDDLNNLLGF